ncbi:hypothetical protein AN958_00566 [Leucoagaricus sp. SymC.cos]|nr:hypothetical protein AN958_00566 [Leucoagaricus sp. SymC.cos]
MEETVKWLRKLANLEVFRRHLNISVDFTHCITNYVVKFILCYLNLKDKMQIEEIINNNCWNNRTFIKA